MYNDIITLLTAYLMGWKSMAECAEWLAGIDWNDEMIDEQSANLADSIVLLTTEILEGLRPESELWGEASKLVAEETGLNPV
jgi:hypothetical protein